MLSIDQGRTHPCSCSIDRDSLNYHNRMAVPAAAAAPPIEGAAASGGQSMSSASHYPVKPFVYVIANITALSGLLFGWVGGWVGG